MRFAYGGPCGGGVQGAGTMWRNPGKEALSSPGQVQVEIAARERQQTRTLREIPRSFLPATTQSRASVATTENLFLSIYSRIQFILLFSKISRCFLTLGAPCTGCGRQSSPGDSFIVSPLPAPLLRIFFLPVSPPPIVINRRFFV